MNISQEVHLILPCIVSGVCGFFIGLERQTREKSAGIRTHLMVCLGSCVFTLLSITLGDDPSRIAAQIVSGIGFLGGGVILRDSSRVTGLTTASTIWVSAAIGMLCGARFYFLALVVSLLTVIFLFFGRHASHLVKHTMYNWAIELKIESALQKSSDYNLTSLENHLSTVLKQQGFQIVSTHTRLNQVVIVTDFRWKRAELSRLIREVMPAGLRYSFELIRQDKREFSLLEDENDHS